MFFIMESTVLVRMCGVKIGSFQILLYFTVVG